MPRYVKVQDAPPVVADNEESVEQPKGDCRHREEVHRCDAFSMIAQKGKPTFRKFRICRCFVHPTGNSSFGYIKAEHEKLTVNPRRSPSWILDDREGLAMDVIDQLLADLRHESCVFFRLEAAEPWRLSANQS